MRDAIHSLGEPDAFLSEQLDILPDRILARLVSTQPIDAEKVRMAERAVIARTGKPATISVRQVASQDEIALLRAALTAPPPPPPVPPQDLESIRSEIVARVDQPLRESWPADIAELVDYELGFSPEGVVAHIRYSSPNVLDAATQGILMRVLRKQLKDDTLQLILERETPKRVLKNRR